MSVIAHNVKIESELEGRVLSLSVSGVLNKEDYDVFVPEIDKQIERYGQIRMLFDFVGFRGLTLGAVFEDTKFAIHHYRSIERIAMVGDKRWEKVMASICKPFTKAEVRYFDIADSEKAKVWLREGF